MKASVLRYLAAVIVPVIVIAGCVSLSEPARSGNRGRGGSRGGGRAPPATLGAEIEDGGFFPDGSHDNETSTPVGPVVADDVAVEGETTFSHFRAIQLDPLLEDTAGPKFVVPADINNDGLIDLVTGWNQSQPVQVHLQTCGDGGTVVARDDDTVSSMRCEGPPGAIGFETITIAGTHPFAVLGGLKVADFDDDGWPDIAVAIKHNGEQAICGDAPVTWCGLGAAAEPKAVAADVGEVGILFNPGTADAVRDGSMWSWLQLADNARGWSSRLDGRRDQNYEVAKKAPEYNSYSSLAVGDVTCDGYPDVVVCFNPAGCKEECEEFPVNRVVMYANPGPAQVNTYGMWTEVWIDASSPIVKDVALNDVDEDGDLDIVFTNPDQASPNISWARNPCFNDPSGPGGTARTLVGELELWFGGATRAWEIRPVGHVDTYADVITMGDVDGDGYDDVLVRSNNGRVVQWFKRPTDDGTEPLFPETNPPVPDRPVQPAANLGPYDPRWNFPWAVFTIKEFPTRSPEGIALGDVTGDGQVEAIIAAGGAVFWYEYDPEVEEGLYDVWLENFVVDDTKAEGETADPDDPDFRDAATYINTVAVVDLDGDGINDVIATLDRQTKSGLADDSLIWFRNTKLDPPE